MWFLWFYLISTAIVIICLNIISFSIYIKLKKENYIIKKKSIVEKISALLPFLIPFLNIFFVLIAILNQEKLYEKIKQENKNEFDKNNIMHQDLYLSEEKEM